MRKRLSSKQFENMIAECVGQVLAESRQPQNRRVTMNEAQMHNFVRQIVNEELENEGFFKNLVGGVKNAFGGDATRIGNTVKNVGNSLMNGAKNVGGNIANGVQQFGNRIANGAQQVANNVQQGAQDFGRAVGQRFDAAKAGYTAARDNNKIQQVIDDLQKLQSQGVLHGKATNSVIQELIGKMKMLQGGNNANASAYRNRIGSEY